MRISDWSSDVCSSDLLHGPLPSGARSYPRASGATPVLGTGTCAGSPARAPHDGVAALCSPWGKQGDTICAVARACLRASFCCRSEEHTSELQSLMRISYAVFCLKKKKTQLK